MQHNVNTLRHNWRRFSITSSSSLFNSRLYKFIRDFFLTTSAHFPLAANTAAAAAGILFFCSYVPYFFFSFQYGGLNLDTKLAASLSPNVALAFSCVLIALQEANGSCHYPMLVRSSSLFNSLKQNTNHVSISGIVNIFSTLTFAWAA